MQHRSNLAGYTVTSQLEVELLAELLEEAEVRRRLRALVEGEGGGLRRTSARGDRHGEQEQRRP